MPFSKTPYGMAPAVKETKGMITGTVGEKTNFIRPSSVPWEAPVLGVVKKDRSQGCASITES